MMKRSFQVFLALVLSISMALPVWAAGNAQLTLDLAETAVEKGDTFSVAVEFSGNPGFQSLQAKVLYDEDLLTCTEVKAGALLRDNGTIFGGNEKLTGKATFAGINVDLVEGDGVLAELTFRAEKSGSADLSLELVTLSASGKAIPAELGSATVRVLSRPGDSEDEPSANKLNVSFSDVPESHWAHSYIQNVVRQGLFTGISNTQFGPDIPVTRGMFVTVLYGHAGAPSVTAADFSDVSPSAWYARSISWASGQGIVSGIGDDKFGPELSITREQLALILYQYAKGTSPGTEAFVRMFYPDGKDVSDWALTAMSWAINEGLISGKTGNLLAPKATATRAEVAVIMQNFVELSK